MVFDVLVGIAHVVSCAKLSSHAKSKFLNARFAM